MGLDAGKNDEREPLTSKAAIPPTHLEESSSSVGTVLRNLGCVVLWISLSATVILYNKWILSFGGFPYAISLTILHMFFSGGVALLCIKVGLVAPVQDMTTEKYCRAIVPIGFCFAGTLWLGNSAYMYLSVSFIQMLKALSPVAVFLVGCFLQTEMFSWPTLVNMSVITVGVAIASYGELNFVPLGVLLQLLSVVSESVRLTLVQILLQKRGLSLNPITSCYYIAPVSGAFLLIPFTYFEAAKLWSDTTLTISPLILLANAAVAFALNVSVFLLIGQTSALTMNVAGVIKDWLLIALSALLFKSPVTNINIGGYGIAFAGVCLYNYRKMSKGSKANTPPVVLSARPAEPKLQA